MADFGFNMVGAVAATSTQLPPAAALGYEYVVTARGVFIRAEAQYLRACVLAQPFFGCPLTGLAEIEPYAELVNLPRISTSHLWSVIVSARAKMPNEGMFQFIPAEREAGGMGWQRRSPRQTATRYQVDFEDNPASIVDLHSHNTMGAFFSPQDNRDEQGFRLYCVIGRLDTEQPEILCRVGVFGHFMNVPMTAVFDCSAETPIVDLYKTL